MVLAMLNAMIGPDGMAILNFYFAHAPIICAIIVIWGGTMTYASLQLDKIHYLTIKLALDEIKNNPDKSNKQIWKAFNPKWQEEVSALNVKLILNRWNFWVTKPTPEKLIEILRLGPEYFEAIRNGEVLPYRFSLGKNSKLSSFK